MSETILKVDHLKTYFDVTKGVFAKKQIVKAVDDVSFEVYKNETFGLVGESGCGKSTLGRTIVKLYEPTDGSIEFEGKDISKIKGKELKAYRKDMQMIFQDPYASLNPRRKILDIVAEGIDAHGLAANKKERNAKVIELLETVGLQAEHADRFPHEFSGGQRQRVGIARALAVNPDFIVCDEPISALDVSIQAQVINLLEQLQRERGLTYLFIAHDLSMVKHISDRIGVMYLGSLVELADSEELFENPMHPYTKALLSAIPIPDPDIEKKRQRIMLEGTLPNPIGLGDECKFCSRCPVCQEGCHKSQPKLVEVKPGHFVACSQCTK
ncbi:MAG: ATP-binding cassette domain-containing protein [Erysipelotrichaceae bacterium]|nr:ATP-binding cassette domain-containing protein [Erysipelotrichaceae bacterium]